MTTIAVNKKMIAADKQMTHSSGTKMTGATKIYELPESAAMKIFNVKRALVGFCGNVDSFANAITWLHNPDDDPPKVKGIEMLLLTEKGIYHASTLQNWTLIKDPFFAIGTGMQFAMAAMEVGKTPFEAVKIASKFDNNTGQGFNKIEL